MKHVSNEKTAKDVTTDEEPKDANVDDFIEELTEQKDVSEVEKIIKPKETKSNIIEEDLESDSISSIKSSIADKFKIDDDSENTDLTKIISYEDKDEDLSIKSVKETQDDKKSDDDSDSIKSKFNKKLDDELEEFNTDLDENVNSLSSKIVSVLIILLILIIAVVVALSLIQIVGI